MLELLHGFVRNRALLIKLAHRDLTVAYSGSIIGRGWVLIDPLMYVGLTLFFFQFAIRAPDTGGIPYVAWVLPQIVFWTFISGVVMSSVNSIREYAFLLRYSEFDPRLIAVIKLLSAGMIHVFLIIATTAALALFLGVSIGPKTILAVYFFLSMCVLLVAIAWLVSALSMFWKDMRNLVGIVMQVQFWLSPIFWTPERFPQPIKGIMYLNPFYYPMAGYRKSLLSLDFGIEYLYLTAYFWTLVAALLYISSRLFKRLSRSFGDVL
jgi:ABC-type polysaccharide/polyol phosphate export permease